MEQETGGCDPISPNVLEVAHVGPVGPVATYPTSSILGRAGFISAAETSLSRLVHGQREAGVHGG